MASGNSNTNFLSTDSNDLCAILKLKLQEKQGGNFSGLINDEINAIVDKSLEYKCICTKQH